MTAFAQVPALPDKWRIQEKTLVLGFVFVALPFFDMLTGFLVVRGFLPEGSAGSPSQIGRLLATFLLMYYARNVQHTRVWIVFFVALLVLETLSGLRSQRLSGVIFGYVYIFRFLYMYFLFLVLVFCMRDDIKTIAKYLNINLIFICSSIILSDLLGISNSTYGWGGGTKGLFASGNGVGIYIGVVALILIAMRRYRIYEEVRSIGFVLAFYSLVLLGTKTAFVLAVLVLVAFLWHTRSRWILLPLVVVSLLQFWSFISEFLIRSFDVVLIRYRNSPSVQDFLFSIRNEYVSGAFQEFFQQDVGLLRWLFGGGAFLSFQNPVWVKAFDTLETDPFDVLFMYGMVGVLIYVSVLLVGLSLFLRYPYLFCATLLLWAHSIAAGHVLFNGMGSTLIVTLIAIGVLINRNQQQPRSVSTA